MKNIFIISGIIAAVIVGYLLTRKNNMPGTDSNSDAAAGGDTGGFGSSFGANFGTAGFSVTRNLGEPFTDWIARRNADNWGFNTKLV